MTGWLAIRTVGGVAILSASGLAILSAGGLAIPSAIGLAILSAIGLWKAVDGSRLALATGGGLASAANGRG